MEILTFTTEYMGSHIYFIIENQHVIVIDPSDIDIINGCVKANGLEIDMGILTHEHCDHAYSTSALRDYYHCPIIASHICNERLQNPQKNYSQYYSSLVAIQTKETMGSKMSINIFVDKADLTFSDVMEIKWKNHSIFLKETPGHTAGSICILIDNHYLFSGDSLFRDEKTNLRFPGGSKEQYESITIPWFRSLSEDTMVYPGHYENFRLGDRLNYPLT